MVFLIASLEMVGPKGSTGDDKEVEGLADSHPDEDVSGL